MLSVDLTPDSVDESANDAILLFMEKLEDLCIAKERLSLPGRTWTLDELEREIDEPKAISE